MANVSVKKSKSCQRSLTDVPFEKGFHFCTDGGNYTGITAVSLADLVEKLKTIDSDSLDFHIQRNDFQKWVKDLFCDEELAWKIDRINHFEDKLRQRLVNTVSSHINFLVSTG